jgi:hypothetical protein
MTTPINLTQLRERANLNASEAPRQMLIERDIVAALIDTAEAAIAMNSRPLYKKDFDRLRETLNHYTTNP